MADNSPPVQLLTVPEVAERLHVSLSIAWKLVYANELASVKIGRSRRVSAARLIEYIERLEAAS